MNVILRSQLIENCSKEETMLPNDEIELTFELMNKDVQDLENDFSAPLEANNRATPELRESVESIFSDIKKKIETIQTFDFKPKIEDAKASVKESCNKKRLKEIEKVSLNKEMIGLNKEMSNLCKRIANCEDEFETCENDVSSAKKTLDTLLTDHLERIHEIEKGMDYLLLNKEELDRTGN
jgi:predicted  nucleic acid-binding Zn-ribbon protein